VAEGAAVTALDLGAEPHRWPLVMSGEQIAALHDPHGGDLLA